jgi:hypothetical protein
MAHLIYFTTTKFNGAKEPPNPINPIAGHRLLNWLREELGKIGWEVTEPDAEDWGWYVYARKDDADYLVGASGEMEGDTLPTDWIVQIHKRRTFIQKLTGKNKLSGDDSLTGEIENIVRRDANVAKVEVDRDS